MLDACAMLVDKRASKQQVEVGICTSGSAVWHGRSFRAPDRIHRPLHPRATRPTFIPTHSATSRQGALTHPPSKQNALTHNASKPPPPSPSPSHSYSTPLL